MSLRDLTALHWKPAVAVPSRFCFIKKIMKKQKRLATCGLAFAGIALLSTKLFLVTEN